MWLEGQNTLEVQDVVDSTSSADQILDSAVDRNYNVNSSTGGTKAIESVLLLQERAGLELFYDHAARRVMALERYQSARARSGS